MKAKINGIEIEGTPQEIRDFMERPTQHNPVPPSTTPPRQAPKAPEPVQKAIQTTIAYGSILNPKPIPLPKFEHPLRLERAEKKWSPEEDSLVLEMFKANASMKEMVSAIKRTPVAIIERVNKLDQDFYNKIFDGKWLENHPKKAEKPTKTKRGHWVHHRVMELVKEGYSADSARFKAREEWKVKTRWYEKQESGVWNNGRAKGRQVYQSKHSGAE